jgi:hypothetical protein
MDGGEHCNHGSVAKQYLELFEELVPGGRRQRQHEALSAFFSDEVEVLRIWAAHRAGNQLQLVKVVLACTPTSENHTRTRARYASGK